MKALPGVHDAFIVRASEANPSGDPQGLSDGVAVVAKSWWLAERAREQLDVDVGRGAGLARKAPTALPKLPRNSRNRHRNPTCAEMVTSLSALKDAAQIVEAAYSYPFLSISTSSRRTAPRISLDGKVTALGTNAKPGARCKACSDDFGNS